MNQIVHDETLKVETKEWIIFQLTQVKTMNDIVNEVNTVKMKVFV